MFVRHLYTDLWQSGVDIGRGVDEPSWETIGAAIQALDAATRTIVTISDREMGDQFLLIAGAWDGRVLVNATRNNQIFFSLVDPERAPVTQRLLFLGEIEEHEDNKLVPLDWAIEAARHFYETGERTSTFSWMRDA